MLEPRVSEVAELTRRGALVGTSLTMRMVRMVVVVRKVLANDHDHDSNSDWSEGQDLQKLVASVEVFQPHKRRKGEPEGRN